MKRILYRSYAALENGDRNADAELTAILEISRRNNARDGLTGALLHTSEAFTQVIEGPDAVVEAAFERICCDLRHRRVQLLELTDAETRVFDGWAMAHIERGPTFHALAPLMSIQGDPSLKRKAARSAVQLMRACLSEPVEAESQQV